MLHDIPLLYQITSDFFPAFTIDETNNKYINALIKDTKNITQQQMIEYIQNFETHLRFILLFIGIMSSIMQQYSCNLVLKGGKAIQMNCVIPYQSNDIDILVVSNEINKKEIAIEISKLLIWMISQQTILNNMSMIEIDKAEPIIKLSIYTRYGFEAVVDIGINDPKEEIKSYVTDVILTKPVALEFNYSISQSIMIYRAYPLQFISQSVDGMIKEKLYYYLKYVVLKKFTEEDNVEIFIPKIYRSLNALFGCIDKTRNFFKKLSGIINVVINEKKKYLTDLSTITIEDKEGIVNDILIKTNSA
jgi:hypothetical protein